jgi:pimeloyl-ACP methyl ester carboxylesterase
MIRLFRMLLIPVALYALIVVAAALFQRRMIYFPTVSPAAAAERTAAVKGFVPWRNGSGNVIGWKLPSAEPHVANVLVVHGNAGSALDRDYFARPIHDAAAVDVYILEYPGYGSRAGSPSMTSILEAADEALRFLPMKEPVYVVGESLGSGVAAHIAQAEPNRVAGLALFMPYDNLVSVAQFAMPFLPVSLLLRDRFTPAAWLEQYRGPLKVVLAGNDRVIPPQFGQRLFDGYAGPKELQIVPRAGHNDVADQSTEWWKALFAFWQRNQRN